MNDRTATTTVVAEAHERPSSTAPPPVDDHVPNASFVRHSGPTAEELEGIRAEHARFTAMGSRPAFA